MTDRLYNAAGSAVSAVSGRFADRVIRLGVTGFSRAGKTVFIPSLVANLLNRERMLQLLATSDGHIQSSFFCSRSPMTRWRGLTKKPISILYRAPRRNGRTVRKPSANCACSSGWLHRGCSRPWRRQKRCIWTLWITLANGCLIWGY